MPPKNKEPAAIPLRGRHPSVGHFSQPAWLSLPQNFPQLTEANSFIAHLPESVKAFERNLLELPPARLHLIRFTAIIALMRCFLDESGDPGLKINGGSSRFFVMALVTFADDAEVLRCDQRIDALRRELHLPADAEFHYAKNPWKGRAAFLQAIQPFAFRYHIFVLDKDPARLSRLAAGTGDWYQYAVGQVFAAAKPYLSDLTVVMDKRGSRKFQQELSLHLRNVLRDAGGSNIRLKLSQQDSYRNNLLQLADYVASISNQALSGKRESRNSRPAICCRKRPRAPAAPNSAAALHTVLPAQAGIPNGNAL